MKQTFVAHCKFMLIIWSCGLSIEDQNATFCITWTMTTYKRHKLTLCPLNGLSLFGPYVVTISKEITYS